MRKMRMLNRRAVIQQERNVMDDILELIAEGDEQTLKDLKLFVEDLRRKQKMDVVEALPVREKVPENGLSEILFVIDQSGSMGDEETEKAVVANFNKVITQQRGEPGDARVSTILFNTHVTTLHDALPIADVPEMQRCDYVPAGGTALLDAVGMGIKCVCKRQSALPAAERPATTIVVIITDGEENSSYKHTQTEIKQMIQTLQEKHGWNFLYFGANVDHFAEASNLGIGVEDSIAFDADEMGINLCMSECCHRISERRVAPNRTIKRPRKTK
ncbi:MAG: VWA domain-containing protein [Kiritimatiellae bacterium]|nr:VWA domain-containing protein [Kiritimatiellia bacterium]